MKNLSDAMLRAMALYVAEHGAMKQRLVELGEIKNTAPLQWSNGKPLVDLDQVISDFIEREDDESSIPRPSDN